MRKFFTILLILPASLYAANYLYCPKTSSYVQIGDSLEKTQQTCGSPLSKTNAPPPQKQVTLLRWTYSFQPHSGLRNTGFLRQKNALVIDFEDRKIVRILVKNTPVQSTTFCNSSKPFKIGDTARLVQSLCNRASKEETILQNIPDGSEQTILAYQFSSHSPVNKLYFQNNKLRKIEP